MNMNEIEMGTFIRIIRTIVQQELRKSNFEYTYAGIVKENLGNNKFLVRIPAIDFSIQLLNKTGESLSVSDSVLVRCKDRNLGNGYIAVKNG